RTGRGRAGGTTAKGEGVLRRTDRHSLRGRPTVGGRDHRAAGDARDLVGRAGRRHALRRGPRVQDGRVTSVRGCHPMTYRRFLLAFVLFGLAAAARAAEPPVYVVLWFDTE